MYRKPNLFSDNPDITLTRELQFLLSQYAEYKQQTYINNFEHKDGDDEYVIKIKIIKNVKI